VTCSLTHPQKLDPDIWANTSTSWGVGLVVGDHWAAWKLKDGWRADGRDIGWAESVALELAALWMVHTGFHDAVVTVRGDNMGVIGAYTKGCP